MVPNVTNDITTVLRVKWVKRPGMAVHILPSNSEFWKVKNNDSNQKGVSVGWRCCYWFLSFEWVACLPLGRKLFPLPVTETHLYCYRPVWLILVISAISRSGATVHPDQAGSLALLGFRRGSYQGRLSNGCIVRDGVRGGAVGWGTALQAERPRVGLPKEVTGIFHWLNPSDRTVTPGSTQPPTDISTRDYVLCLKAAGAYSWQPCHFHMLIL